MGTGDWGLGMRVSDLRYTSGQGGKFRSLLSRKFSANKIFKARAWPWLAPFLGLKCSNPFTLQRLFFKGSTHLGRYEGS